SDATGVQLSNGNLGLVLFRTFDPALTTQAAASYALTASGTGSLVGVNNLSLSGDVSVRINTTGTPVTDDGSETGNPLVVSAGGQDVALDFRSTGNDNVQEFAADNVVLTVTGVVDVHGNFSFTKTDSIASSGAVTTTLTA